MNKAIFELHTDSFWQYLSAISRLPLIHAITPLQPLLKLSQHLDTATIWCKRDDLISFGLGGNKIRGLELLAADAINKRADILVTGAGIQSNHVRATAITAAFIGMQCHAVFWGNPPQTIDGNYRLTHMLAAHTLFTENPLRSSVDSGIKKHCNMLLQQDKHPYAIPRGGACALGTLGHALAARELYQQCQALNILPKQIILATGSGGTHAGWLLGTRALGNPWTVESYTVSRAASEVQQQIVELANAAATLLNQNWQFNLKDVLVHDGFIGSGYGIPSPDAAHAIRLLAKNEGILLDPTYTGKAMAGLLENISQTPDSKFQRVFIHTGGEPAFFAGEGDWL